MARQYEDGFTQASNSFLEAHPATNILPPYTPNGGTWTSIDSAHQGEVIGGANQARPNNGIGHYLTNAVMASADYSCTVLVDLTDSAHGVGHTFFLFNGSSMESCAGLQYSPVYGKDVTGVMSRVIVETPVLWHETSACFEWESQA